MGDTATPSIYHNGHVGKLEIEAPAKEIKLKQSHPYKYYVYQKVEGKEKMYKPEYISEAFSLPLKIAISYKSNLSSTGDGSFAYFYALVRRLYQGQNLTYKLKIDIPLVSNWDRQEINIARTTYYGLKSYGRDFYGENFVGLAISYNLFLHLYKVQGSLLFDNLVSQHSATNYARDPYCDEIDRVFTREFSEIDPYWEEILVPDGAVFSSIYPL